jgi:hypothetical protein
MPSYEIFGKFYDAVMGDGSESAKRLSELVRMVMRGWTEQSPNQTGDYSVCPSNAVQS